MKRVQGFPIHLFVLALTILGICALNAGCASTGRGRLDIRVAVPPDPVADRAVVITRVTDARRFDDDPDKPSTPSLPRADVYNKELTLRAIARKSTSTGNEVGDILLPQGRTVELLVKELTTKSFRESGYRVVEPGTPEAAKAIPIQVDIEQFWSWFETGFWSISLHFEGHVLVKGNLAGFKDGRLVSANIEDSHQVANGRAWQKTINNGVGALGNELTKAINSK